MLTSNGRVDAVLVSNKIILLFHHHVLVATSRKIEGDTNPMIDFYILRLSSVSIW